MDDLKGVRYPILYFIFGRSSRLSLLKNTLVLVILVSLLLSVNLWLGARLYPLTPIIKYLPTILPPWDIVLFILLLFSLTAALISLHPRKFIILSVSGLCILAILDQSRWQPEFYQFFWMLVALSVFSWKEKTVVLQNQILITCQLIIGSVYVWSGIQKINHVFLTDIFPWMLDPFIHTWSIEIKSAIFSLGVFIPLIEICIGIGLLTKKLRDYAVISAIAMHLFVLSSIGPFGHNWNNVIWPWNIAMACFVVILFWKNNTSLKEILFNNHSLIHYITLLLFAVMPILSFLGLWDSYLSSTLYSGNIKDAKVYIKGVSLSELPAGIGKYSVPISQTESAIDIYKWSFGELNVPPYPEDRIFKNIGKMICGLSKNSSGVNLVIAGKPHFKTGTQISKSYSCLDL